MPPRNTRRLANAALLATATDRTARLFGVEGGHTLRELDVDRIETNPEQPRRHFEESDLAELTASIERHGLLQPVCVQETAPDRFRLVAGERRLRAFVRLGRATIPAMVVRTTDPEALSLIENVQRVDLDAFEVAGALDLLLAKHGATHAELGSLLGKSQPYVTRTLGILRLPAAIREEYAQHRHVPASALMIIAETDGERRQMALWRLAKSGGSVRALQEARKAEPRETPPSPDFARLHKGLSRNIAALQALHDAGALGAAERTALRELRDALSGLLDGPAD